MSITRRISLQAAARLCALAVALSCASRAAPLVAQTPQSTVPHPPDTLKPQPPNTVPHPPDVQKQTAAAQPEEQPGTTFKVNVKLVNVFTTVTDSNGSPVSSLKQEDFQVLEDDKPQKIAVFHRESELPLSIVVAKIGRASCRERV